MKVNKTESFESAKIGFRNFAGKETQFNPAGSRVFSIFMSEERARGLEEDGWNIRWTKPRDPDDAPEPYLSVKLNFTNYPPKIVTIKSTGRTVITENNVHILDWAEYENIDIIVRPYNWEANGKHGVKAYLKVMYITLVEDEFEKKYKDIPSQEDEPPF